MALSPLSRSSFSLPSTLSTSSTQAASTPSRALSGRQGAQQSNALQKMLMSDGFDSPMGMGGTKAAGVEATVRMLSQVAELLAQSVKMLGSELGTGSQPVSGVSGAQQSGMAGGQSAVPDLGAAPSAPTGTAPSTSANTPASAAPSDKVAAPENVSPSQGGPKGARSMTFTNDGTSPMTIQFTPNAGEKAVDSVTLKPGETRTVDFPENWSGNFRSTAGDGKAATLGEVKFNGGGNQTYYDVSYIEGNNAAMTIQPESGGRKSGTLDNLLASAPDSIKAKDGSGNAYGIKKSTTSNVQDGSVVDYYRTKVGADQGYVIPTDDASTLGSGDSHLSVHLKNLT